MDTLEFLRKVLPGDGLYVLAEFWYGLKENPKHTVHGSLEDMVKRLHYVDRKKVNVFHACASYKEHLLSKSKGGPGGMRKTGNAATVKAQWIDLDVGEDKPYKTRKQAMRAAAKISQALDVALPLTVSSGRGLHCYWVFDQEVDAREAQPYMAAFARFVVELGVKHDASRTSDIASILRPVGSHHRKADPIPVELVVDAAPISVDDLYYRLEDYIRVDDISDVDDEWSTGPREYPPSYGHKIIKFCPTLADVAKQKGDVEEPLWRAMLGVAKHCDNGYALGHQWSDGHPEYDYHETQDKMDNWTAGPTTCAQFAALSDACKGCPHKDTFKSPIHLGYDEPEDHEVEEDDGDESLAEKPSTWEERRLITYAKKQPAKLPFWPKRYRWDGETLSSFIKGDDDTPDVWVPCVGKLVYPFMRYQNDAGEMMIRVSMLVNQARSHWKEFDIPAKVLADNRAFSAALGAHEVYCMGVKGTIQTRQFFQDIIAHMQELDIETKAYTNFGWHGEGFVIGTTALVKGREEPVFLSDKLPASVRKDYGRAGSAERWAELVDEVYNRPGAEPYQFVICAGFGAPLVAMAGSDLWHGIPIALTGEGGLGKTTVSMVACSIYGAPSNFFISTNDHGTTMNSLITKVGIMRHLPMVLDEMTGRKTEELQAMLYALANGRPKERNRPDGTLIDNGEKWDTLTFITGNMNITSMLAQMDKNRSEATQLRCFEIPLADNYGGTVFKGVNAKELIEHQLLGKNYGEAGREYMHYVVKHQVQITDRLKKMREKFSPSSRDETRERFYYDCMVTALLGGTIAKKLGLIDFDMKAIQKWAVDHIKTLRVNRATQLNTVEDYLAEFLSELHGKMVVTEHFRDGRSAQIFEVDSREVKDPVARVVLEDKLFYVANSYFNKWCAKHNIVPKWFKDELEALGVLLPPLGGNITKVTLFKGTSLPSVQTSVVQFNYDKIMAAQGAPNLRVVGGKQ